MANRSIYGNINNGLPSGYGAYRAPTTNGDKMNGTDSPVYANTDQNTNSYQNHYANDSIAARYTRRATASVPSAKPSMAELRQKEAEIDHLTSLLVERLGPSSSSSSPSPSFGPPMKNSQNIYANATMNNDVEGDYQQLDSVSSSLYEPINPRPSSQISDKSNYSAISSSIYAQPTYNSHFPTSSVSSRTATPSLRSQGLSARGPALGGSRGGLCEGKSAQVDKLTDLLVKSMENSADPDFFEKRAKRPDTLPLEDPDPVIGICYKCGEKVLGEGSGCTAMDRVYHVKCLTCTVCHKELRGKPFYAMEGKPYCEDDYLNTLEKCARCKNPILDRILRATGKPYHPKCFMCTVCNTGLEGIPFTVDAQNSIYCIPCFHQRFAPKCHVCREPIVPESGKSETVRIVALDKSFHVNCYKCEDCGLLLRSEAEGRGCYPLDDHILCKDCNRRRVQLLCN